MMRINTNAIAPEAPKESSLWDKMSAWGDKANEFLYGSKPIQPTMLQAGGEPPSISTSLPPTSPQIQENRGDVLKKAGGMGNIPMGLKRMPSASSNMNGKSASLHPDMLKVMSNPWPRMA